MKCCGWLYKKHVVQIVHLNLEERFHITLELLVYAAFPTIFPLKRFL